MNAVVIPLKNRPASFLAAPPGSRSNTLTPPASTTAHGPLPPYTAIINSQRLQQLRRQHGMTREQLAGQAGIGFTTLARLERQHQPRCRTRTLGLITRALNEDPETLVIAIRHGKNTPACTLTPA